MTASLTLRREAMRFRKPFRISGYLFEAMPAVVASIARDGKVGRGEAAGVYYLDDGPENIERRIEDQRQVIEGGIDRQDLGAILPAGGARNAIDCALWELESLERGLPVWALAGVGTPRPLTTTFTLPAEPPAILLEQLLEFAQAKAIKLKLDGDLAADTERVRAVRRARPDVWLGVDANQGYGGEDLDALVAMLVDSGVALLEQPVARGAEALLEGWKSPIPLAADESIQSLAELEALGERFDVVNIKLDKCGGLTEGLMIAAQARRMGLGVMVGNMGGSTLSTAPAFVLGQLCDIVDLDGPIFLPDDLLAPSLYADGQIMVRSDIWGHR
ncbi:mandelate racemase [Caulobacter sp. Root1455]|jgi:L-alanine-DL-glutamate epimerase-like enolase superfamily enzyme|uniref:dipeptide epimerase n=1 Tax=Caulobacter sp. Root1455 TaxID=1736465 RepID=UPI0006FCD392|nr:dipeptide epimerase [Caulobacter sp. Root1455]KQY93802.1 mandelate racemase [Caulobacter sp. Root1455]